MTVPDNFTVITPGAAGGSATIDLPLLRGAQDRGISLDKPDLFAALNELAGGLDRALRVNASVPMQARLHEMAQLMGLHGVDAVVLPYPAASADMRRLRQEIRDAELDADRFLDQDQGRALPAEWAERYPLEERRPRVVSRWSGPTPLMLGP